ncbi:MAG TPA: TetR/AcrR family transcriptional regulator [Acidimicrobiales bacterium]|nr:TetR/AcrR family transcriptional regulator [Acidimicrobiales bacterium]
MDGRQARGARTRLAVLEATISLVTEGVRRPTAEEVARRAGVALRTLYHHFAEVDDLRSEAFGLQIDRHVGLLRPIDPTIAVAEQVTVFVRQLRRLFEAIGPLRRSLLLGELASPDIAARGRQVAELRRRHLERTFAEALQGRPDRRQLIDALDAATSWWAWEFLRAGRGGPAAAERVIAYSLRGLLAASPPKPPSTNGTKRAAVRR